MAAVVIVLAVTFLRYQVSSTQRTGSVKHSSARAAQLAPVALAADRPGTPAGVFPGWFVSETTGWITVFVNGHGELQKTSDGGRSWTTQLVFPFARILQRDMKFLDATHGFVIALRPSASQMVPVLYRMTDGTTWVEASLPQGGNGSVKGMDFVTPQRGWILFTPNGSRDSAIYMTTNAGSSWSLLARSSLGNVAGLDSNAHMEGMRFRTPTEGWISAWAWADGSSGLTPGGPVGTPFFYATKDGGRTWAVQNLRAPSQFGYPTVIENIEPPHFFNAQQGIAAVVIGSKMNQQVILYTSSDGGITWGSPLGAPSMTESWGAYDSKHIWVAGDRMFRYDGGSFSDSNSVPPGDIFEALDFVSESVGYAIGSDPKVNGVVRFTTRDGGMHWTPIS